jgi:hypothetical protein
MKMPKATVITTIRQEIEMPEGADKQAVYNFLAENQSFRDAFVGISDANSEGWRITEVMVLDEEVDEMDSDYEDVA